MQSVDEAQTIVAAVAVNQSTSLYAELMLRSLFSTHDVPAGWSIALLDNASTDDSATLWAFCAKMGVAFRQSGQVIGSRNNSHGDALQQFVLDRPDPDYYLFLDTDVCYVQRNTIVTTKALKEARRDAWLQALWSEPQGWGDRTC